MIENARNEKNAYITALHRNDSKVSSVERVIISRSDCQSDAEFIARNNIHVAIARKALAVMLRPIVTKTGKVCYPDGTAVWDILLGYEKTVSLEDIASEVYLALLEALQSGNITIDGDNMVFADDITRKAVFSVPRRYLYDMQTRHYKRTYIEIDSDVFISDSIASLMSYETEDTLTDSPFWLAFTGYIRKNDPKNADDIIGVLSARICGAKVAELSVNKRRYHYCIDLAKMYYTAFNALDTGNKGIKTGATPHYKPTGKCSIMNVNGTRKALYEYEYAR